MGGDDKSTVVRPVRVARGPTSHHLASIEVLNGSRAGELIPLTTGSTLIGRSTKADITLDDDGVSRRHAKLAIAEEGVVNLIDLDSTNGTFLNGAPVDLAIVREGDRIQIGSEVGLRFGYRTRAELSRADPKARAAEIGLSKRELEVAVLVADGLTNNEVGAKLFISPRTVAAHLTRIYDRLSLSGRAALTRLVVQQGLLR